MDVGARNSYPANALSNFSAHYFTLDGVFCASLEGFLQSLKFKNPEMQVEVCKLIGFAAKKRGAKKNWQESQILWWLGKPIRRSSDAYQELLTRAYNACYEQSESFRNCFKAAGKHAVFTHSIGRIKEAETVLTQREFCALLMSLKERYFRENG